MIELLSSSRIHEDDDLRELVVLGLNHEQQHQELLLSDIKYILGSSPIFPAYRDDDPAPELRSETDAGFVEVDAGIYEIGHDGNGFCFDNETNRHKVYLNEFSISKGLVTNLDFLLFMKDGGYNNFRYWHADGWDWVRQNSIEAPLYWQRHGGEWYQYTLGGLGKLDLRAPVCHVSFYEAAAFAEWREMRLPTEFEWEAASSKLNWGTRWEWTNSAYLPYPGFRKSGGAVGEYNGKFMVNQMVLRGASIATPEGHSRPTYRNFFYPHSRWQFTGIRLAK
jgi:ergothioneine biosynthesis protein EgtB